uniref:DNA/RNA-binding protein Kin17 WH-like domain-containing protein n=1 Tax=Araucaria cunninghamii TaxID=56994 RepID=A0A0D6R3K2_ARACU
MGKNDFLTPKAIANRIKAKGLQKLRWYCQMCQKQCRDENGFKCHCMSEGHQRQMQVFGQNPDRFVDGYSEEFQSDFLEHVKRSHRFSRVAATVVYNEYIADRHHVHMNSTQWATLTEFVKYLGRMGKCKVDETSKGWFITYIDRESETLLKEKLKNKRLRSDLVEEERHEKEIQDQIERAERKAAKFGESSGDLPPPPDLGRPENLPGGKVAFSLSKPASNVDSGEKRKLESIFEISAPESSGTENPKLRDGNLSENPKNSRIREENPRFSGQNPNSRVRRENEGDRYGDGATLGKLMEEEERKKEKMNRKDYWLCEGIVVKVMSKGLAEKGYYKEKGVVVKVIGKYVGEIKMMESGHVLRVDQAELETVIPQIGGVVRVVNGAYRGCNARLLGIDTDKFCAKVQIEKSLYDGRLLQAIEYEDICKVAGSS